MDNPVRRILDRCKTGFSLPEKLAITVIAVFYGVSPVDLCPDFIPLLGFGDDVMMAVLLFRVWSSPTLPDDAPPSNGPAGIRVGEQRGNVCRHCGSRGREGGGR